MDLVKPTGYSAEMLKCLPIPRNPQERHRVNLLKNSVKFGLPDNGMIIDIADFFGENFAVSIEALDLNKIFNSYIDILKLPYPIVSLEFQFDKFDTPVRTILIAEQKDDGIRINTFISGFKNSWVQSAKAFIDNNFKLTVDSTDRTKNNDDELEEYVSCMMAYILLSFLSALNCSNVKQETVVLEKKYVTQSQSNKHKKPFFTYKVLTIDTKSTTEKSKSATGTHASPRVHLRRGHIRRLPNKTVWVNACVVGDKSKGMVQKDYEVK